MRIVELRRCSTSSGDGGGARETAVVLVRQRWSPATAVELVELLDARRRCSCDDSGSHVNLVGCLARS